MFVIGEKLNGFVPKTKEAINTRDAAAIRSIALMQANAGADALDICTAAQKSEEEEVFRFLIENVQAVTDLPLSVDSPDPEMCLKAAAMCARPGIINSVSPEGTKMDTVFSALAASGWHFVALLTDEKGATPDTVEGRIAAFGTILKKAKEYGISEDRLFIDPMVMTLSTDSSAYGVFSECVRSIRKAHPNIHIVSGTSNISMGLPKRRLLNVAFLRLAGEAGMDAAICDPVCVSDEPDPVAMRALETGDTAAYLAAFRQKTGEKAPTGLTADLAGAITEGNADKAKSVTEELLKNGTSPEKLLSVMTDAMTGLGERFSAGTAFIPELIMAAKAMKAAGGPIRTAMGSATVSLGTAVIGTVMGDMHDIGKNLVGMMLECAGFNVIDMGTDVLPEDFLDEALQHDDLRLIGLSCLLTTTMPAMQETVEMLRSEPKLADIPVFIGGAPVSEGFKESIGADRYTEDAVACAREAKAIVKG